MPASPILRPEALAHGDHAHGTGFAASTAPVAAPLGATRLGARHVVLPAGKAGWPFHCHHANDELFVILAGSGTLRFGADSFAVAPGDVVVCPAGGPETAHQLRAGPDAPLAFLAVSSMHEPDVMEYPDSGKVTVFAGAAPGGRAADRRVSMTVMAASTVDYWLGED